MPGTGMREVSGGTIAWALLASAAVWAVSFAWRPANFWLLMGAGVGGLGLAALWIRGPFPWAEGLRPGDAGAGLASAALLYGAFALGRVLVGRLVAGGSAEISAIYSLRSQAPWWMIALLVVCVIGPGEEFFWRGLVQWALVRRLGSAAGWGLATAIYGGVHLAARNPMLAVAALAAGGFWGLLYLRTGRIAPPVVSHIAWDLAVFLILPLP